MAAISYFSIGAGFDPAFVSAVFLSAGLTAHRGRRAPFDVLGLLLCPGHIGSLFADFRAGVFGAGAIGCGLRAALRSS